MIGTSSTRRPLRALLAAVVGVLMVSACAPAEQEVAAYEEPELEDVAVVSDGVRLPLDAYELPWQDRVEAQRGYATLLRACMRDRGFDIAIGGDFIRPVPQVTVMHLGGRSVRHSSPPLAFWGGPLGTLPAQHAQQFGYKPTPNGPFVKGPGFYHSNLLNVFVTPAGKVVHIRPNEKGVARRVSEDAEAEFAGSRLTADDVVVEEDEPGCQETVDEQIGVDLVQTVDAAADLSQLAREHPKVQSAVARWATCMAERGHEYADVWEPSNDFNLGGEIDDHQLAVATADVECTAESGWANYYYAALEDYQKQALERDPQLWEAALRAEQDWKDAVERELAETGVAG